MKRIYLNPIALVVILIFFSLLYFLSLADFTASSSRRTKSLERIGWVIPDSIYIRDECLLLEREVEREAKVHTKSRSTKLAAVQKICRSVATGQISRDQWLVSINPVTRELYDDSCNYCLPVLLGERQPIPDNFASYSVFLTPNEWLGEASDRKSMGALYEAFDSFGAAIGDYRAAIWFSLSPRHASVRERAPEQSDSGLIRLTNSDVLRSKSYCDRFGLNYNDGPYVVTTKRRPDLVASTDEKVVIRLAGIPPAGIVRILNILEQDLRKNQEIRRRALLFEEIKERIVAVGRAYSDVFRKAIPTIVSARQ